MRILLIHGMGHTSLSLLSLEWRLRQVGWATEQFAYAAFLESYSQIVERLRQRLQEIASQGSYSIVAHSLGGLLTRSALDKVKFPLPEHVIMLGTPNRLPRLAALGWQLSPFQWFADRWGFHLASPKFFARLPPLQSAYTIIAGTEGPIGFWSPFGFELNDGIVALSETIILDSDRPLKLPVNHTFMMNVLTVQETIIQVLRHGKK
ncbi:alpha/beta hydrolase [Pleurocapsales cyanobacterium LEGE 06147]|nr:alpha/beta hydrolase [Pleurocapsales cyanobacterium LEGE 06147]